MFWKKGVGMGRKLSLTNLTGDQDVFLNDPVATLGLSSSPTTPPLHMDTPTSISVAAATNSNHPLSTTTTYPTESDPVRTSATLALSATHNPPTYSSEGSGSLDRCHPLSPSTFPIDISGSEPAVKPRATHLHGSNPRASTLTTDTASTLLASPFVSSNSLSSILHGDDQFTQSSSITTTAATTTTTTAAAETCTTIRSSAINTTGNLSTSAHLDVAENGAGAWRPFSVCSTATDTTTTTTGNDGTGDSKANNPRYSTSRQRSRATDILLNLEASSNDGRFQEILHNTIALDHFRQFCFQEYSIENLLFWMDVELFAKPSEELLQMGSRNKRQEMDEKHFNEYEGHAGVKTGDVHKSLEGEEDPEQFAVQHARYIYLTYIDSCGPLQVNLSDESRTDIPWPILDYQSEGISIPPLASSSLPVEKRRSYLWGLGSRDQKKEGKDIEGWPLDRRMFDGAQEHTYQLMKGHTLVRFEESDLWKAVEKIKKEQPEEYARAMIRGPLNTYYRPDKSLILSTVKRSRSRHPAAKPQTLYNWNNSTSDLDRSKDKEEPRG
ncbi:MAG: hypothetical protein J3Q66DRAFT_134679 [Benniella sp.]|nr:MAG: hypothetical protein J3Q66DRAFT_134679 [Benniella sp.]